MRINGVPIQANEWSVEPQIDTIDVSNFEGSVTGVDVGFKDYVNGLRGAQLSIEGWMRADLNYFDAFGGEGSYVSVVLYTQDLGSPFFHFPVALLSKMSISAKMNDIMRCNFSLMNRGPYFYPTGV